MTGLDLTRQAPPCAAVGEAEERRQVRRGSRASGEKLGAGPSVLVSVHRRPGTMVARMPLHAEIMAPTASPG
jgi:hypothetical protein